MVLSELTLADLRENPAVPYEQDEVTRIIQDDVNTPAYEKIRNWTVAEFREWLLDENTTADMIRKASRGNPHLMWGIATVTPFPRNDQLRGRLLLC